MITSLTDKPIKIMIADDHQLFADGLSALLSTHSSFEIIGNAKNGREILQLLNVNLPDILIMDLNMPILDGEAASEKIIHLFPSVKILVLSMYHTDKLSNRLKDMGVMGFLPKDTGAQSLFQVIEEIQHGKKSFKKLNIDPVQSNIFINSDNFQKRHNLTARELEILTLIKEDYSSQQIAAKLYISINTVDTHRKNMIQKLNVPGKTGLLKFAIENNLF